ncbi:MAG: hypothetical protein MJA29_04830, partial [Candidatus Omnitrophica bacterium]|nr:hypothetical protein [Candidatus Omnitrophota bacterium]
ISWANQAGGGDDGDWADSGTDLYLNATYANVGIGTTGPARRLDILDATNPQLRLTHTDSTDYTDFQVDTDGDITITPSGDTLRVDDGTLFVSVNGSGTHQPYASQSIIATADPVLVMDDIGTNVGYMAVTTGETIFAGQSDITFKTGMEFSSGPIADGAERMRIESDGDVGIGTSSPSAVLDIRGAGSDSGFSLRIADSAATDRLVVLDNGNVGIGITAPAYDLDINGVIRWGLNVLPSGTGAADQVMVAAGDGSISWANQTGVGGGDDGDWAGSGTDLYLNATYANVGIGMTAPSAVLDIQGSGTAAAWALRIADSDATDRLVVLDNGNVGIGTTSPGYVLDVAGDFRVDATGDFEVTSAGYVTGRAFETGEGFRDPSGTTNLLYGLSLGNGVGVEWSSTNEYYGAIDTGLSRLSANTLAIGNGTIGDFSGALIVDNVGIGITAPAYELDVNGVIRWGLNVLPSGTGAADQVLVAAGDGSISWAGQAGGGDDGDWDSSGANLYLNST